jgi:hypothetical protein
MQDDDAHIASVETLLVRFEFDDVRCKETIKMAVRKFVFIAAVSIPLLCSQVQATAYSCTGTVDNVTVALNATVTATFLFQNGNMPWMSVCSLSQTNNGIPVEACRGILAVLTTAQVTQKKVQMWFDNSTPNNCSYPAGWQWLSTMGYYYGPALMN